MSLLALPSLMPSAGESSRLYRFDQHCLTTSRSLSGSLQLSRLIYASTDTLSAMHKSFTPSLQIRLSHLPVIQ